MATFVHYIYYNKPKADGTFRVYIRMTHNRSSAYIPTPYYISAKAHKGGKIVDRLLLSEIDILINAYNRKMILLPDDIEKLSAKELAALLQKKEVKVVEKKHTRISFSESCYEFIQVLYDEGRQRTGANYLAAIRRLEEFFQGVVYADQLTTKALEDFELFMRSKKIGSRGVNLYMINLKRMFKETCRKHNDADTGKILIPNSPWERYKIPQARYNKSQVLSPGQIRDMAAMDLKDRAEFGRDMFLLSFCLAGMNSIDLYNARRATGPRLEYRRRKTTTQRQDGAFFSILIQPEANYILNKYKHAKRLIGREYSSDNCFNAAINKGLKVVGDYISVPDLNFYMARHSFATIARNKCGVSKDDIGMALNHTDEEHKTTDIYLQKDWTIVDRVVRKVLDYVFEARESIR